nr:hypothetical protein [Tanacetum cinerariifolium]
MNDAAIKQLMAQGVATALVEYEANRSSGNGDDIYDSESGRRTERATCECTYSDFIKCQPLNFKGTEGLFATCNLLGNALTWWNSHFKTIGRDAAYGMSWKVLNKMMTDKYCPRSKIKKLEIKIWNLKVKGTDVVSYTQRFQELALMCGRMFLEESNEAENKRKLDSNKQQPPKKQNVVRAYSAWSSEKKKYAGTLPLCNKYKVHHNGPCIVKYANCKRVGHLTRDCRSLAATNNQRTLTCYECGNQGHYKSD